MQSDIPWSPPQAVSGAWSQLLDFGATRDDLLALQEALGEPRLAGLCGVMQHMLASLPWSCQARLLRTGLAEIKDLLDDPAKRHVGPLRELLWREVPDGEVAQFLLDAIHNPLVGPDDVAARATNAVWWSVRAVVECATSARRPSLRAIQFAALSVEEALRQVARAKPEVGLRLVQRVLNEAHVQLST